MNIPVSPYVPENLVSRDGFSRPVPSLPAHVVRDSSQFPRRREFIYLNCRTPSGQSRVYRVTQLRTNGVLCRESAGTGPVNLKVVPVTSAAILQVTMDQLKCASLRCDRQQLVVVPVLLFCVLKVTYWRRMVARHSATFGRR